MKIPKIFNEAMKDWFYDKDMEIWTSKKVTDRYGDVIRDEKDEMKEQFKGNFHDTGREYIQKEYGQDMEANAIITCEKTVGEIGDIVFYNGKDYLIKGKRTPDSHTILIVYGDDEYVGRNE